jgi:hypothetical protein
VTIDLRHYGEIQQQTNPLFFIHWPVMYS